MERFQAVNAAFAHSIDRAKAMIKLYDALCLMRDDPSNDDALRAAYIQAVSSFDFFVHETALVEAEHRIRHGIPTRNISLPMPILHINDTEQRIESALAYIREQNGYKAFVDPAKLAQALSNYCETPWRKIHLKYQEVHGDADDETALKRKLKNIWYRRNKMVHEADINPVLSGIGLWPIDKFDAEFSVDFIEKIGGCIPSAISSSF